MSLFIFALFQILTNKLSCIRREIFTQILHVKCWRDLQMTWKLQYIGIRINFATDSERPNLKILKFGVRSSGSSFFTQMCHHQFPNFKLVKSFHLHGSCKTCNFLQCYDPEPIILLKANSAWAKAKSQCLNLSPAMHLSIFPRVLLTISVWPSV